MINTRFLNFHDVVLIGAIVIIVHLLVKPLLDTVGVTTPATVEEDTG